MGVTACLFSHQNFQIELGEVDATLCLIEGEELGSTVVQHVLKLIELSLTAVPVTLRLNKVSSNRLSPPFRFRFKRIYSKIKQNE